MSQNSNNMAAYIWSLADLLRGDFKQSQFGRIILPFTLLRRLEGVLEETKAQVLAQYEKLKDGDTSEEVMAKMLLRATGGLSFFNTSKLDLANLGHAGLKDNLEAYLQAFSKDAREIFEHFKFIGVCWLFRRSEFIVQSGAEGAYYGLKPRRHFKPRYGINF